MNDWYRTAQNVPGPPAAAVPAMPGGGQPGTPGETPPGTTDTTALKNHIMTIAMPEVTNDVMIDLNNMLDSISDTIMKRQDVQARPDVARHMALAVIDAWLAGAKIGDLAGASRMVSRSTYMMNVVDAALGAG